MYKKKKIDKYRLVDFLKVIYYQYSSQIPMNSALLARSILPYCHILSKYTFQPMHAMKTHWLLPRTEELFSPLCAYKQFNLESKQCNVMTLAVNDYS